VLSDEFLGLIAHELRTPVSAIIGYHDLMSEGLFGELPPRAAEGVDRIRSSANQILTLVASLAEAAADDPAQLHVEALPEDPGRIFQDVMDELATEAVGRSTAIDIGRVPDSGPFRTDAERLERGLLLALHAVIKNSAGGALRIEAFVQNGAFQCTIAGARLNPLTDMAPESGPLAATSACALRLAMAVQTIRPMGGNISLNGSNTLTLRVPEVGPKGGPPD
jgi:signal transduction histidine kinase